ncbi:hypothetical protein [Nannocystis pusilla]|uniref:hypothetical protein n=1 Tax=Nannocystis pusilla TaxID=889268 RepID=UPI003DA3F9B7
MLAAACGRIAFRSADPVDGRRRFARALELAPDDHAAALAWAAAELAAGNLDEAVRLYQQASAAPSPRLRYAAFLGLGVSHARRREREPAEAAYRNALSEPRARHYGARQAAARADLQPRHPAGRRRRPGRPRRGPRAPAGLRRRARRRRAPPPARADPAARARRLRLPVRTCPDGHVFIGMYNATCSMKHGTSSMSHRSRALLPRVAAASPSS